MKQTIEIDVPDGMEICSVHEESSTWNRSDYTVKFKKKEPEFIEVREYLWRNGAGCVRAGHVYRNDIVPASLVQHNASFIKWIDPNWRKVQI